MNVANEAGLGAKKKIFLDETNSAMTPPTNQFTPVGGVGARGPVIKPYMPASLDEFMGGVRPKVATPAVPSIEQFKAPAPTPMAPENIPSNEQSAPLMGGRKHLTSFSGNETVPVGTGIIVSNSTGNVIPVGNVQGFGARTQVPSTPASPVDLYADAALREVANSDALMNAEIRGTKMTNRGQVLTEGSQAVGNGIVARGALNRAKILSDISNSNNTVQIGARNSNVNAANVNSMIEDRGLDNTRQDQVTSLGARKGNLEIGQLEQLSQLQDDYLKETDPTKRQLIGEQLASLTGKSTEKYQPIMGRDELGNPAYLGAFNSRTGQATNLNSRSEGAAPPAALAFLKKNPDQASAFKAKYGYLPAGY